MNNELRAGANAWRKVEGVMMVRKISKKCIEKVLNSCVAPASVCGLETVSLTELQQRRLQLCEINWTRRIAVVKKVKRRRKNIKDTRSE